MNTSFSVGIDLGGTRVKMGIVSGGVIVAKHIVPAEAADGLARFLPELKMQINKLIGSVREGRVDTISADAVLDGIGIAFPGLTDYRTKKILSTNAKYDDAVQLDLGQWVQLNWSVPLAIDNDARMAALGEWKYGAATDTDDLVVMTIGTGIGTSAVMEGRLVRGRHLQAGCLGGHFTVNYQGRSCSCGNVGCVEAYGSTWSLQQTFDQFPGITDSVLGNEAPAEFKSLFAAAKAGDAAAAAIREDIFDVWSAGIVNLIHAYDPEVVVIGGGVMHSADQILPFLKERVRQRAWTPWGEVQLRATKLADDAGILGIVHLLKNAV